MLLKKYTNTDKIKNLSLWRKLSLATWKHASCSHIYTEIDIDATNILKSIQQFKQKKIKITPTAIVGKAVAMAVSTYPETDTIIKHGKVYHKNSSDIFFQISAGEHCEDVSGITIRNCKEKSIKSIALEIRQLAEKIRSGKSSEYQKRKNFVQKLPTFLVSPVLKITEFINFDLNIWTPLFGPRDYFGCAMVSSVGSLGLKKVFAPLVPFSRCPVIITIGKINEQPVVESGKIVIKPILTLCGTFDHRLIDGYGVSCIIKSIEQYLVNLDQEQ
jgi:pyruvate/2-oxoglutarate dehydrogenase complex dihydrolipoamide acyltransferase (E2) component